MQSTGLPPRCAFRQPVTLNVGLLRGGLLAKALFPFHDLHGYKDYVGFVRMCAPDQFPARERVSPSDTWSLELAFEGLRLGLSLARDRKVSEIIISECEKHFEAAYGHYLAGERKEGFKAMTDAQRLISKVRTQ